MSIEVRKWLQWGASIMLLVVAIFDGVKGNEEFMLYSVITLFGIASLLFFEITKQRQSRVGKVYAINQVLVLAGHMLALSTPWLNIYAIPIWIVFGILVIVPNVRILKDYKSAFSESDPEKNKA